jgi:hypothetical protein
MSVAFVFVNEVVKLDGVLICSSKLGVSSFKKILDSISKCRFDFEIRHQLGLFDVESPESELRCTLGSGCDELEARVSSSSSQKLTRGLELDDGRNGSC